METDYNNKVALHEAKVTDISQRMSDLSDRMILLKLMVTNSMITNYQTNEQPSIETLNNIQADQNQLIKEIEDFYKK